MATKEDLRIAEKAHRAAVRVAMAAKTPEAWTTGKATVEAAYTVVKELRVTLGIAQ